MDGRYSRRSKLLARAAARKTSDTSGGTIGFVFESAEGLEGEATGGADAAIGEGEAAAPACPTFPFAVPERLWICARVSGPRRYESAHRDSNKTGADSCALLIIDMQRDFLEPGGFGEMLGNDVSQLRGTIEPNKRLLATWRARGWHVIHTREGHRPDLGGLPHAKKGRGRSPTSIGD